MGTLLSLLLSTMAAAVTPSQGKTCLLFVGPHKTGSTTLETQLHTLCTRPSMVLSSLGYEWLEVPGIKSGAKSHASLPQALAAAPSVEHPQISTDEALAGIPAVRATDRALSAVPKHVVIAAEDWCRASAASLRVLGDLLARNGFTDVRVVINWRPYAQRTLSAFQEIRRHAERIHTMDGLVLRETTAVREGAHSRCSIVDGKRRCRLATAPYSMALAELVGCPTCYTDTSLETVQRFVAQFGRAAVHVIDLPGTPMRPASQSA